MGVFGDNKLDNLDQLYLSCLWTDLGETSAKILGKIRRIKGTYEGGTRPLNAKNALILLRKIRYSHITYNKCMFCRVWHYFCFIFAYSEMVQGCIDQ